MKNCRKKIQKLQKKENIKNREMIERRSKIAIDSENQGGKNWKIGKKNLKIANKNQKIEMSFTEK